MRIPPPEVILSWPPPRYDDPETRGPANQIVSLILLAIASVILAIRIYTRKCISKGFGWDDILVVLAYIPAAAFVVVGMISMDRYGWGRHIWDVPVDRYTSSLQMGLASQILFDLATTFTKLSMLALIYRIAHEASYKFCILVIGLGVFIGINGVIFMVVAMLQCRPLSLYWTLSVGPQNCINEAAHLLSASIINTLTDFVVVLLPLALVRVVYKNKLSPRQLLIVNLLFGTGFLASFAGVARTYFTWIMATEADVTWNAWMNWLMSSLELFLGIICTSIPSTKPFFNRFLPKLLQPAPQRSERLNEPTPTDTSKSTKGPRNGSQLSLDSDMEELVEVHAFSAASRTSTPLPHKMYSDAILNKPLPAVETRKDSVYTIKIQLDEASLGPADRRARTANLPRETTSQPVHNFSRPTRGHARNKSDPHSDHRLSHYSVRDGEIPRRATSVADDDSRYSHILDTLDSRINDLEAGIRDGSTDQHSLTMMMPTSLSGVKRHKKSPSAGTFGG